MSFLQAKRLLAPVKDSLWSPEIPSPLIQDTVRGPHLLVWDLRHVHTIRVCAWEWHQMAPPFAWKLALMMCAVAQMTLPKNGLRRN